MFISPSDVNSEGIIEKTVSLNTNTGDWVNGWDLNIEVGNMLVTSLRRLDL